jgi:hypothetical protein
VRTLWNANDQVLLDIALLGFDCHLDQRATLAQYLLSIVLMSYSTNECLYQCSELVSVLYERNPGVIHQVVANLEAVSSGSATLLCEEKIQSRTPISFCAKGHDLYGSVESSALDSVLGWFITIKLDRSSRWHSRMFVPNHFLALSQSASSDVTTHVTSNAC